MPPPSVEVWHNILWSKYKGAIFGEVFKLALERGVLVKFVQIAETETDRQLLGPLDSSYHQYPYELIAKGSYDQIPWLRLCVTLAWRAVRSDAAAIVTAGYHRPEYWVQMISARLSGKRVLTFCDGTQFDRPFSVWRKQLKRFYFQQCDAVFCYGQRSAEYVASFGVPQSKLITGCQAAALPHDYDPGKVVEQRQLLCSTRTAKIIFVGRLAPEKNLDLLLDSFSCLLEDMPHCQLRIIGDGPERERLQNVVAARSWGAQVEFAGALSGKSLFNAYLEASCLVLPSKSEPWGLVVNEALSYGCPVIVSDRCGCVPELVVEGVTGYTFESGSVAALTRAVSKTLRVLSDNPDCSRRCVQHMTNFTPKHTAERFVVPLAEISSRSFSEPASAKLSPQINSFIRAATLRLTAGKMSTLDLREDIEQSHLNASIRKRYGLEEYRKKFLRRGVVFIHIPRNGGTSIATALYREGVSHVTAKALYHNSEQEFRALPSFSIVRNPIDRFISSYRFIRRGGARLVKLSPYWNRQFADINDINSLICACEKQVDINRFEYTLRPQYGFLHSRGGDLLIEHLFTLDADNLKLLKFLARFDVHRLPLLNESEKLELFVTKDQAKRIQRLYSQDWQLYEALCQSDGSTLWN